MLKRIFSLWAASDKIQKVISIPFIYSSQVDTDPAETVQRNLRWCGGQLQDAETLTHQGLPKDPALQQGADAEASPTNLNALDNGWLCRAVSGTRDTGLKWIDDRCSEMFAIFCSDIMIYM